MGFLLGMAAALRTATGAVVDSMVGVECRQDSLPAPAQTVEVAEVTDPCEEEPLNLLQYARTGRRLLAGDDFSLVTHSQLAVQSFQYFYHRSGVAASFHAWQ